MGEEGGVVGGSNGGGYHESSGASVTESKGMSSSLSRNDESLALIPGDTGVLL